VRHRWPAQKLFFLLSIEITSEKRRGDKMMNEFLNAF
jgi:hypothetical protein